MATTVRRGPAKTAGRNGGRTRRVQLVREDTATVAAERRQLVRYLFLKLDPVWRRLAPTEQIAHKEEFGAALKGFHSKLMLRTYSMVGTRGDCDIMLWQAAENLEALHAMQTTMFSTRLGSYFDISYSYLAMTRRSIYEFPDDPEFDRRDIVRPADNKYLFLYPFVKTREWYSLPKRTRQEAMDQHVAIGRKYPSIRLNTTYSFGLDDQEFMVAFEGDDPGEFLDLVMELRSSISSSYTQRDTPIFTCIQMSIWDALDSLGGATAKERLMLTGLSTNGFVPVATVSELPPETSKRVYRGSEAIALFNVNGEYYAVSDRCTHGRGSLSEGNVDPATCLLECPWHGGKFNIHTGEPKEGPVQVPIKTYEVRVQGDQILVGSAAPARQPARSNRT